MHNGNSTFEAMYQREKILGRGASGVAYVVRPRQNPAQQYVAKEICVVRTDEKRRKEAFAESQLLRTLCHENIVACFDVIQENEMMYIVMEYANGGDLGRRIQIQRNENKRLLETTVMSVFVQICMALHYIHSRKVLHRDLKPANIFMIGEGEMSSCTVKLGDFGISKIIENTMGQVNSTVGTPSYLSPEICKNHPYGMKADVWSLGVVLYELTCLRVPFQAGNLPAMALMICKEEPKPVPDEYGAGLADLIKDLLQKEPNQRPMVSSVLRRPYVSGFLTESLRSQYGIDETSLKAMPEVQGTQRTSSLPTRPNRTADASASRLPSCGSARSRQEKLPRAEDPSQWCWRRPGCPERPPPAKTCEKGRTSPRANSPRTRRRVERSDRNERAGRCGDRGDRAERADRAERPEQDRTLQAASIKGAWHSADLTNMTMDSLVVTPDNSGLAESDEDFGGTGHTDTSMVPLPAEWQEPPPPGAGPPTSNSVLAALWAGSADSQTRVPRRNRRRGKPPLLVGQESVEGQDVKSPTRPNALPSTCSHPSSSSHSAPAGEQQPAPHATCPVLPEGRNGGQASWATARSVSPAPAPKPPEEPPAPVMRTSGSAPSLPPLPPLLAPQRDRVSRSRSVVALQDHGQQERRGHGEAFQPLQRTPLFRTAPLRLESDSVGAGSQGSSLPHAPAPQPQQQQPQRQATREDSGMAARLVPKLPTAFAGHSESRHWREGVPTALGRAVQTPVREGWGDGSDVDSRLPGTARLSVV